MRWNLRDDRGAAAVEFALVLPVLVTLVLGMIDFSRIYDAQISLSNAAREGARTMVVTSNQTTATTNAQNAAPALGSSMTIGFSSAACAANTTMTATASVPLALLGPFFPTQTITLTGRAAMQCGG